MKKKTQEDDQYPEDISITALGVDSEEVTDTKIDISPNIFDSMEISQKFVEPFL